MGEDIRYNYFWWMVNKIFHDINLIDQYGMLLVFLDSIPFEWSLDMDENRQKDAQDLRYIYGEENGYTEAQICRELDTTPPSFLEVVVALINRAEENILYDPEQKFNLNQDIFMDIIANMGIDGYTGYLDDNMQSEIRNNIQRVYTRDYSYNGEGGMFVVHCPKKDMRDTEIWFQFMWYLDEKLGGKYL